MSDSAARPTIQAGTLRPYVSVFLLETPDGLLDEGVADVLGFLRSPASQRTRAEVVLVAEGLDPTGTGIAGIEDTFAFVHRVARSPSWQAADGGLQDTEHLLSILAHANDLIAVHVDRMWADRFQTWLDRPRRRVRRVPDHVLQHAFLQGETKGLWLRGAHAPLTTKPDSKTFAGRRLQDVLNPHNDGTFALVAGRAAIADDPGRVALTGNVGTTPARGLVWCRPSESLVDFLHVVAELFAEIRTARRGPTAVDGVFPVLAGRVTDLREVSGAFEIGIGNIDDIPSTEIDLDRLRTAAHVLDRAVLDVSPRGSDTRFVIDVGLHGAISGQLGGSVVERNGRRLLDLGFRGSPSDAPMTRHILDALLHMRDLLTIRYRSGHAFMHGDMICSRIRPVAFPGWSWESFDG